MRPRVSRIVYQALQRIESRGSAASRFPEYRGKSKSWLQKEWNRLEEERAGVGYGPKPVSWTPASVSKPEIIERQVALKTLMGRQLWQHPYSKAKRTGIPERKHRQLVENALRRGDPVPDAVLAEYPELRGRRANQVYTSSGILYVLTPETLAQVSEQNQWVNTVASDNLEGAHALIRQHGGTVLQEPTSGTYSVETVAKWASRTAAQVGSDTATIYAIAPEMLHHIVDEWKAWADVMWAKGTKGVDPEEKRDPWEEMSRIIRQNGGAVFNTDAENVVVRSEDGSVDEGVGYLPPYHTPEEYKAQPPPKVQRGASRTAAQVGTDVAEIYAISPEMLHKVIGKGEWFTLADSMWGQKPEGSFEEVWATMQEIVREHGGAVFQTGGDGAWDVTVSGGPGDADVTIEGQGYTAPYGTPEFGKEAAERVAVRYLAGNGTVPLSENQIKALLRYEEPAFTEELEAGGTIRVLKFAQRVAARHIQARRIAFWHGLRKLMVRTAGWWQINVDKGSGGIWWGDDRKEVPKEDRRYNGDGPADRMGDFLSELDVVYRQSWGRPAYPEELRAVFEFVFRPTETPGKDGDQRWPLNGWIDEAAKVVGTTGKAIAWMPEDVRQGLRQAWRDYRNSAIEVGVEYDSKEKLPEPSQEALEKFRDYVRLHIRHHLTDTLWQFGLDPEADVASAIVELGIYPTFDATVSVQKGKHLLGPPTTASASRVADRYLAASAHAKSIALMKFLSGVAKGLGSQVAKNVYVVGGAVRDFVLDRPIKDVDVVVDSVALGGRKDAAWFAGQVKRAIPTNVSVVTNQYLVEILTVSGSWMLDGYDMKGEVIEIANTRAESYAEGGWKPETVEPADIRTDVTRRELTYNCMTGDTLIPTERGLLRIDQVASREEGDQQEIRLLVAGREGPATAIGWQYSGHTETVRVTTEWGHEFGCTGHHPVLVLRGHDHEWVQAGQLEPGDLLCIPTEPLVRTAPLMLDLPDPPPIKRGWLKEVQKPTRMSPELAYIIGCVVSEGSNTYKRISFSNSDPGFLARYAELFATVFGFLPSRNQVAAKGDQRVFRGVPYTVSSDCFDLYADSKTLVGWLGELGLYCGGSQGKKSASHFKVVPWSILEADAQSQAAFLAAYLEGDGSIETKSGRITYISASPVLRRQLQALLGAHGILSQVKRRFVMLTAADSAKLWKLVAPFMVTKTYDYEGRSFKSRNRYGIPKGHLFGFLRGRRIRHNQKGTAFHTDEGGEVVFAGWSRREPQVKRRVLYDAYTRGEYDDFLNCFRQISVSEHAKLATLLQLGYQYVPVRAVEDNGTQDVFDISMDEGVEPAFVGNGVVVHNTLLLRLIDLAKGPDKKDIIDLTGCGLRDLEQGVMQCPASPDVVFSDDPTRMVRVIKFALRYGHKLTPDTKAAILRNAPKLKNVPTGHLSQMLAQIVLTDSNWKKALVMMQELHLLEPVKELMQSDKSFRAALQNHVNSSKMDMLFGLLDVGIPLGAKVQFLSSAEQTRLRQIALGMDRDEAWEFLELLKNPNRGFKDDKLFPQMIIEYGLSKRQIGKFRMQVLEPVARGLLLADPALGNSPSRYRQAVVRGVARAMQSARLAAKHLDQIPGGVGDKTKPADVDPKQLAKGIKVEMEHTDDRAKAQEIALDHLSEPGNEDYYDRLETIEKHAGVTGDGSGVGLFIPLPKELADQFPSLGDEDTSPPHTTLLYIGHVTKDREKELLTVLLDVLSKESSPIRAWTAGIDHFVHPHKDRRVYYVPIRFSRDMGALRDRITSALDDAGFVVENSFPLAFNAHATLEYTDGIDTEYEGEVPNGAWEFSSVEVWGLSKKHEVLMGTYEPETMDSVLAG